MWRKVRHDNLTYMTHFMAGLLQHKLAHEDACNDPLPEEFMGVVCLLKASVYIFSIASMEDNADKSICATDILHFCNPFEQVQKKFWTVFSNSSIGTYFGSHQIHPIITRNTVVFVIRFKSVTRSYSNIIFLKKLEDKIPFLGGYWYPCFGLPLTSVLKFKARVDPSLAWFVTCMQWTPQIKLGCDTCWPLEYATHCVFWAQFRNVILTYGKIVFLTNNYYSERPRFPK